ncbi:geranylgeranyl reductase family protein [Chloroflexota bacterium]
MIVMGGGPVGSHVAYRLADMGYEVVVLEKKANLAGPVCCTGIVSRECVRAFGIDNSVILREVKGARIFSPAGNRLDLWRSETQACIVDRPAFNAALARRARSKGAEYVLPCLVEGVKVGENRIIAEVALQSGESTTFEARAGVIATGFGAKVVEGVELSKVGDFISGAQAQVETVVEEVEVYLGEDVAPGFFAWLVPTSPGKALAGLLSRRSPGKYLGKLLSSLAAQGKIASAECELSYGGVPLKPLSRTYSDRLVVVGGAAGQVKPTTGGGIYYGLLCADIAADILQQKLKKDALSAADLAAYQRQWKNVLGGELKTGYRARKLYERLSDRQIDQIFAIIKAGAIDEALLKSDDLSFDWHGAALIRLMGYQAVTAALRAMKLAFKLDARG